MTDESVKRLIQLYEQGKDCSEDDRKSLVETAMQESPQLAVDLQDLFDEPEVGSVTERLERQYGSSVDPHITLERESQTDSKFATHLVGRLGHHSEGFERYRLKGELGRGGQGAILKVWDEELRRHLAMKVILGDVDGEGMDPTVERGVPPTQKKAHSGTSNVDPMTLGRFLEEAQITSQLDHPGIVPVHELGLDSSGRVYFTMKLVKGLDMKAVFLEVHDGGQGWTQTGAVNALLRVCEAVSYAHAKGVIHRDLKPGNVMVGKYGEVFVMDWGLARVMARKDERDLRFEPGMMTTQAHSPRHNSDGVDSPLITMDGTVVGTPAYMSPEQALGRIDDMGPPSDVYALGAMLYDLLAGHPPYIEPGKRTSTRMILFMVQQGPPRSLALRGSDLPAELVAICERAMERDIEKRYPDTSALAEDLKAYLENKVVAAYETGAVAELRKWVRRNRSLAAALAAGILAVIAGLGGVSYVESKGKEIERAKNGDILRLSAAHELEELETEADRLWPPGPDYVAAYDDWLTRAAALVAGLHPGAEGEGHIERLARIRSRANPWTPAEQEADRQSQPEYAKLGRLERRLKALRMAQDIRQGKYGPPEVRLDEDALPEDASRLSEMAERMVHGSRLVYGDEARGLALARQAVEWSASDAELLMATRTLAGAFLSLGQEEKGLEVLRDLGLELEGQLTRDQARNLRIWQDQYARNIAGDPEERARVAIDDLALYLEELEQRIAMRRTWSFASVDDAWWHAQISQLVDDIQVFQDPEIGLVEGLSAEHGWGVRRRKEFAETIAERSTQGEDARAAWDAAIASISDREKSPAYRGLVIEQQAGILPVGQDPRSGLWEFAHLMTGAPAARGAAGALEIGEETGVVLVLIAGGDFHMGAQWNDPSGPNYDPQGNPSGSRAPHQNLEEVPVHRVTMSPYFLSKYELTQAQWQRLTGANPSRYHPGEKLVESLMHPVESMSWYEAQEVCTRAGLTLPSEAQWEYAARAGTQTVWWTGNVAETLESAANLKEPGSELQRANVVTLHDGFGIHAPVDALAANPFGLHCVIGNVMEWCFDGFDPIFYGRCKLQDPVAKTGDRRRVVRGGGFISTPVNARSAYRNNIGPETAGDYLGFRPARALDSVDRKSSD